MYSWIKKYCKKICEHVPNECSIQKEEKKINLLDIGSDCIIHIASFINGDSNIHNFISINKNIYSQKKYINFYGYYPIYLNIKLPFNSICVQLPCNYNINLPRYINRIHIVGESCENSFDVEEVILELKDPKLPELNLSDSDSNSSSKKNKIKFGNKLKKIYIKNCRSDTVIDLSDCNFLDFIGFNTRLIKKFFNNRDDIKYDADVFTNFGIFSPPNNSDTDDNKLSEPIINFNKLGINMDKIKKLYIFIDDTDITINDINNFISCFPNLMELTIDGQFRNNVNWKSLDWIDLYDKNTLNLPDKLRICRLKPNIYINNIPNSLEKLYLKYDQPINQDLHKVKIIKLDYIDDKLLR